jgi:hypothetical protein
VVSRALSTLEGSLPCKSADPSHPTPMEVAEGTSTLEVAAVEDPTSEGGAGSDPASRVLEHAPSLLLPWTSTSDRPQSDPRRLR